MRLAAIAVLLLIGSPGLARSADSWGLPNETPLVVEGKVVDILCELNGQCPANCGDGERQLGILTADGRLLVAAKSAVDFAGPVFDLLPYCGQSVQTDGLLIEHPAMPLYFVQYLRESESEDWQPATRFSELWTAKHGAADEWQRADPRVKAEIEEKGKLGIPGLEPE